MSTIAGYEFAVANNDVRLPSAADAQNEVLEFMTAVCEDDLEDGILIASGLLPQLIARAKKEAQ